MILDQIKVTADREVKRQLAVRAFEVVQQAEQLLRDEEQCQGSRPIARACSLMGARQGRGGVRRIAGKRHRGGPCHRP